MAHNTSAKALKALHVPGKPIVFANVWDVPSFNTIAALNEGDSKLVHAVATASWALAASVGVQDEELTFEQNIAAVRRIAPLAKKAGLPLSADLQDGYGPRIEEVVSEAVKAGVSGANIEDSIPSAGFGKGISGSLYSLEEQVQRLKAALKAAEVAGCPDFTLNARCDVFCLEEHSALDDETRVKEAIARGKAFLDAGATTVFYWGGPRGGMTKAHLETLVKALDGRVAVLFSAYPGVQSMSELAQIGVARVSIGPGLFRIAMAAVKQAATNMLTGGNLAP
ncbi:hypothetical protein QQS21_006362 [Conoideocrella luteorostrata]|uniref:Uncharacterized protein n=1 Tax=Conoideocrella luteorostrata TaxID=1105319 RepID=A0AAJ0FT02_9HYPO|nr:hypothetical protein QQS21_006362 [Conoideocrella luteorostrata]